MMSRKNPYKDIPPQPTGELPSYVLNDFDGDESVMADEIISNVYWGGVRQLTYRDGRDENGRDIFVKRPEKMGAQEWLDTIIGKTPIEEQAQIHTELIERAHTMSAVILSKMAKKSERGYVKLLAIVNQHSMWKSQGEYENMWEFLSDRFPYLDSTSGEYYEVKFMLETMFPLIEQFSPENAAFVLSNTENYAKFRGAASFVKEAFKDFSEDIQAANRREEEIKNEDVSDDMKADVKEDADAQRKKASEKLENDIKKVIIALGDKKVPANGPNGIRHILKRDGKTLHFKGRQFIDGKKTVFYLEVPNDYEKAVTNGLPFVEFAMSDIKALQNEINQKIKK